MKNRAASFIEIPAAGDALQLPPELAAGMTIGADITTAQPAMIGTIRIGTEVRLGFNGAPASSGERDDRRGRAGCLEACIGSLLTGRTERFVEESGEGLTFFRAFASRLVGLAEHLGDDAGIVGPPDMDEEADQHESNQ